MNILLRVRNLRYFLFTEVINLLMLQFQYSVIFLFLYKMVLIYFVPVYYFHFRNTIITTIISHPIFSLITTPDPDYVIFHFQSTLPYIPYINYTHFPV